MWKNEKRKTATTHKTNKNNQQNNNNNNNKKQQQQNKTKQRWVHAKKIKTADKMIQQKGDTQMKLKE